MIAEALADSTSAVKVVPPEQYAARLDEARDRLPRDPTDVPALALALTLDCGIWATDIDFCGSGVAV